MSVLSLPVNTPSTFTTSLFSLLHFFSLRADKTQILQFYTKYNAPLLHPWHVKYFPLEVTTHFLKLLKSHNWKQTACVPTSHSSLKYVSIFIIFSQSGWTMVFFFLDLNQTALGNFAVNVDLTDLSAFNQTSSFGLNQMFVYVFLKVCMGKCPRSGFPVNKCMNLWLRVCVCGIAAGLFRLVNGKH